jgi:hypothetical protein
LDSHLKFGDPAASETGQPAGHSTVCNRELRKKSETHIENAVDPSSAANSRFEDNNPSRSPHERKKYGFFLDRRTRKNKWIVIAVRQATALPENRVVVARLFKPTTENGRRGTSIQR